MQKYVSKEVGSKAKGIYETHLRTTLQYWTRGKHKCLGIEESFDI